MSGRKLGGGRILGSGKGLAPPAPPTLPRSASPLAPSESTISIGSPSSSPDASGSLPDFSQDIGSSISVGAQSKGNAADASALVCPICNEEMVTLLQLNRHIDDNHQELPEEEQDEVKTWFDKQVLKAKRFQPLSIINQKIRGLEVFESNESNHVPTPALASKINHDGPVDPDELITRNHWQRSTAYDVCTDPACGKGLGPINGSINCRKCGRLFCEEHTMYQMKLSRSANHEPVRGFWARVCETCYKSREGYNDHVGVSVDHMDAFAEIRRKKVERQNLEVSRLEKRLTKLTRLLADAPENTTASNGSLLAPVSSFMGQKDTRKLLEQSVVTWEVDETVPKCPFCQQEFGSWTFRRHHCRICGRVVCADPQTGCSLEVGLNVAGSKKTSEEKPQANGADAMHVSIRMCRECNHTIFSGRDFTASLQHKPRDQRAYETLRQFERGIRQLLPSFHRALLALQPEKSSNGEIDLSKPPPTHAQIQEASKIRKRLIDSFGKYGTAAKRMRNLPTDSPTQKRLQEAVYRYSSTFLHTNMLPLKSLPGLLRHRSTPSTSSRFLSATPTHSTSSLRHTELADSETASQAPSETSTMVSQLETEERELRERLAVLEEQKFMVDDMLRLATRSRRFEEVSALSRNADELDGEIAELKKKVGNVEERWEGVYRDGTPA
ncbi:carboxypeptidase Y-deficient [Purpureocillium takamizusanense]|uniref:Carboxypeptidase Y-deficient n=1 Tax=Purpureocillium takamizusanense TaxID=2060973 RepID=A0A9Q8QL30_9HYPO|nr:carboxypeptidase Y-deficient [Purpureocillium takamizusanense]UNI20512.1 carboxypeptidase Y-deficient [Purpureocillium takamizusanense]